VPLRCMPSTRMVSAAWLFIPATLSLCYPIGYRRPPCRRPPVGAVPSIPVQNDRPQCACQAGTTGIVRKRSETRTSHGMLRIGPIMLLGELRGAWTCGARRGNRKVVIAIILLRARSNTGPAYPSLQRRERPHKLAPDRLEPVAGGARGSNTQEHEGRQK
jgi:hypothetical protein